MQPLGRKPKRFPCKVDHHPRGQDMNWWERDDGASANTKAARREAKEAIKNQWRGNLVLHRIL